MKCYKCGSQIPDDLPCTLENQMCSDCWKENKPRPYWWKEDNKK